MIHQLYEFMKWNHFQLTTIQNKLDNIFSNIFATVGCVRGKNQIKLSKTINKVFQQIGSFHSLFCIIYSVQHLMLFWIFLNSFLICEVILCCCIRSMILFFLLGITWNDFLCCSKVIKLINWLEMIYNLYVHKMSTHKNEK